MDSDELFSEEHRMALLEDCDRFARETGATLTIQFDEPILEANNTKIIVRLSHFISDERNCYPCKGTKIGNNVLSLFFYVGYVFQYKRFRQALLEDLDIEDNKKLIKIPCIAIPYKSFLELKECKRALLDLKFNLVHDESEAKYIFIIVSDEALPQYSMVFGEDRYLFHPCHVVPRKGLGND